MTADEKEKVVELRLKGLGYQSIANEIGTVTKENVDTTARHMALLEALL